MKKLLLILLAAYTIGCSPSKEEIESNSKRMIQEEMKKPVTNLKLVQSSEYTFEGEFTSEGIVYELEVITDGETLNVKWRRK